MRPILIRSLISVAAVVLVAAGLLVFHLKQHYEIAALRADVERLTPATVRATELRLKLVATDGKLVQLQALAQQLPQPNWQQVLSHIGQSMPDDVWLDRLSFQDGHLAALTGASYTDGGVYDFVGYLKQVPEISEIALEGTGVGQSPTGPTTNFNLRLTLANLAGRGRNEASP
jgi:Tfp pilus assembly protein PilN